jgi:hypothetical protein
MDAGKDSDQEHEYQANHFPSLALLFLNKTFFLQNFLRQLVVLKNISIIFAT